MSRWALRMPIGSVASLGPLRLTRGIEICRDDARLWLRGDSLDDALELQLREIPGAERFEITATQELLPLGALLPLGHLPTGPWKPLAKFLQPRLEKTQLAIPTGKLAPLALVRERTLREPAAILTSLDAWRDYLETAPQVRLARLKFLANRERKVFIVGSPLPPLAGERFWEAEGIYVAAGFGWSPAVDPIVVRRALRLEERQIAIWPGVGAWEIAEQNDFVAARRAAGQATAEGLAHGRS